MKVLAITDKTMTWVHACGCTMHKDGQRWKIDTYCSGHQPNYQAKAEKLMHRREKKGGRGYTKPEFRREKRFHRKKKRG